MAQVPWIEGSLNQDHGVGIKVQGQVMALDRFDLK